MVANCVCYHQKIRDAPGDYQTHLKVGLWDQPGQLHPSLPPAVTQVTAAAAATTFIDHHSTWLHLSITVTTSRLGQPPRLSRINLKYLNFNSSQLQAFIYINPITSAYTSSQLSSLSTTEVQIMHTWCQNTHLSNYQPTESSLHRDLDQQPQFHRMSLPVPAVTVAYLNSFTRFPFTVDTTTYVHGSGLPKPILRHLGSTEVHQSTKLSTIRTSIVH